MEIVVVIVIMGIVASVALRSIGDSLENAKVENTKHEMQQLSFAVAGNPDLYTNGMRTDFGYIGDVGSMPPDLDALLTDPGGYATWSGPYIGNSFSESSDDFKRDAWGNYYTYASASIQSSGGGGGTLTKAIASSVNDLIANTVTGVVTDGAGNPPGDSAGSVSVHLIFPNGSGGYADSARSVSTSGTFQFGSMIPIGNHTVSAIYASAADTVTSYVSVLPGGVSYVTLRFPSALWAVSSTGGGSSSASDITYVSGSATCTGGSNEDIEFDIVNNGTTAVTIDWLIATYTHAPTAYYERVRWNGGSVFFSTSPRAASGETAGFNSTKTISAGETVTLTIENFTDVVSGGGSAVDMTNTDFLITLSDGTELTFSTGS
jgi:hypothetical protein